MLWLENKSRNNASIREGGRQKGRMRKKRLPQKSEGKKKNLKGGLKKKEHGVESKKAKKVRRGAKKGRGRGEPREKKHQAKRTANENFWGESCQSERGEPV